MGSHRAKVLAPCFPSARAMVAIVRRAVNLFLIHSSPSEESTGQRGKPRKEADYKGGWVLVKGTIPTESD